MLCVHHINLPYEFVFVTICDLSL